MKRLALTFILCLVSVSLLACGGRGSSNMYEGSTTQDAINEVKKKAGGDIKPMSLRIYPDRAEVTIQDPNNPEKAIRYEYREGAVTEPRPVTLLGGGKVEDNLFNLADADLAAIPNMAKTAKERLNIAGAEIESMSLSYPMVSMEANPQPKWTIMVKGGDKKGSAVADMKGNITFVNVE